MAAPFHLLTDFDGVWTEPEREAKAVHASLLRELARLAGAAPEEIWPALEAAEARVRARPERNGWPIGGAFTSYVDEDYFAFPAAVGRALEEDDSPLGRRLSAAVLSRFPAMGAFLDHCYHTTCDRFRAEVAHDLAAGAERVLQWLVAHGARVTFVTNAPLEKVLSWFAVNGVELRDGRDPAQRDWPLRAFGRAGKQWLGDPARVQDYGGRLVHVDRPQYRAILEQERPDMVLGDVLSLDLAQPLALRAEGHPAAPRHVALLRRAHTPRWVLDAVGPAPHQIDFALHHVTELPRVVTELRGPRLARAV